MFLDALENKQSLLGPAPDGDEGDSGEMSPENAARHIRGVVDWREVRARAGRVANLGPAAA